MPHTVRPVPSSQCTLSRYGKINVHACALRWQKCTWVSMLEITRANTPRPSGGVQLNAHMHTFGAHLLGQLNAHMYFVDTNGAKRVFPTSVYEKAQSPALPTDWKFFYDNEIFTFISRVIAHLRPRYAHCTAACMKIFSACLQL